MEVNIEGGRQGGNMTMWEREGKSTTLWGFMKTMPNCLLHGHGQPVLWARQCLGFWSRLHHWYVTAAPTDGYTSSAGSATCNIDRVWTTLLPTPSPLTFPLLLSPLHAHLARFLSVSLPLPLAPWSDDSALFAKARGCRVTGTQWANSSLGSTSGLKLSPVYWKAGLVEL